MSKELPGLRIDTDNPGIDAYVYHWLPRKYNVETIRTNSTFLVGVVKGKEYYFPIELDLKRDQPRNIFIVGGPKSGKENFMRGIIQRAAEDITRGYTGLSVITKENDPNRLLSSAFFTRHREEGKLSALPDKGLAAKILQKHVTQRTNEPRVLVIEDLGDFIAKNFNRFNKIADLKTILTTSLSGTHLTIATVDFNYLPILAKYGIGKNITPGIWLFGRVEGTASGELSILPSGYFKEWNRNQRKFSERIVIPFELP